MHALRRTTRNIGLCSDWLNNRDRIPNQSLQGPTRETVLTNQHPEDLPAGHI